MVKLLNRSSFNDGYPAKQKKNTLYSRLKFYESKFYGPSLLLAHAILRGRSRMRYTKF